MMLERSELKRLRLPFVAALLLSGLGAAALVYSENNLADAEKLKKEGHARLVATRDRLTKVSEEEQEIRNNLVQFKQGTRSRAGEGLHPGGSGRWQGYSHGQARRRPTQRTTDQGTERQ